jgi:hypothetical protein
MAGSWKTPLILILAVAAIKAQGQFSSTSLLPTLTTAIPSATSSVVTGPQQRPVQDNLPSTATGPTGQGTSGSNGQGAPQGQRSPQSSGTQQGTEGGGPPGAHGGGAEAAGGNDGEKPKSPFMYMPSFSMAVVSVVGYSIIAAVALVQACKNRSWYFLIVPQGAIVDMVGGVARCIAVMDPKVMVAFMVQTMVFNMIPTLLGIGVIMTFTRVIWWITPNEKRNKSVLKTPPHALSLIWASAFAIPDMVKAVASFLGKPKGHNERPNPTSMFNRIQSVSLVVQFFAIACWTLWALRYMHISKYWLMSGEVIEKKGRKLGWVCFFAGCLVSVSNYTPSQTIK